MMELFAMGYSLLVGGFLVLLGLVLLLSIFGLPGNWILLALVAGFHVLHPGQSGLTIWYWIIAVGIAVLGEALEFGLQVIQAKKHGSSNTGTVGGMIGAIVGAIVCAPFLFGLGALFGAVLGAWTGCFLFELAKGRPSGEAAEAAMGAMVGRFLGTICKLACGAVILAVTAQYLWPDAANLPFHFPWLPGLPDAPMQRVPLPGPSTQVLNGLSALFC